MIASLYQYRRFILQSARNELRDRYAGSGIGIFWNVILPLVQIAIYAIVFSTLMGPHVSSAGTAADKYAFVLYLCAGILPWIAFTECIGRGTQSLVRNARYLQKMALPEAIFVAQSTVEGIFTAGISLTLFVTIGWLLGLPVGWSYLLLPVLLLLFQALAFGITLILAPLNAFFRDIGQMVPLLLQIWMWLTPIVYSEKLLSPPAQQVMRWNPSYRFINAFRDIFLQNQIPDAVTWAIMLGWIVVSIGLGYFVLTKLRPEIRDVL
jgi:ABC-type polysaccharide/polyol phosphate export permease